MNVVFCEVVWSVLVTYVLNVDCWYCILDDWYFILYFCHPSIPL